MRAKTGLQGTDFKVVSGQGVQDIVNNQHYRVGRPKWIEELKLQFPLTLQKGLQESESRGESAIAYRNYTRQVNNDRG
ncbi:MULTISPECIES: hypothetical protein [Spirulina sp. CCY15215]|uniref:hypothetical protein n=1 Tax=Spirulina sp. CCY15215 TaxID=2767591 RepID=UPI001952596F|nr:hypothetical protein [Spirulina major]